MRPRRVVRDAPGFDRSLGIGQVDKPALVETLAPQPAVEALDEAVLDGFAGPNELQRDAARVRPLIEMLARELRPVVAHEGHCQGRQGVEKVRDSHSADRVMHQEPWRLARAVVDGVKTRTVRPLPNVSETRSIDHRSLGVVRVECGINHRRRRRMSLSQPKAVRIILSLTAWATLALVVAAGIIGNSPVANQVYRIFGTPIVILLWLSAIWYAAIATRAGRPAKALLIIVLVAGSFVTAFFYYFCWVLWRNARTAGDSMSPHIEKSDPTPILQTPQ